MLNYEGPGKTTPYFRQVFPEVQLSVFLPSIYLFVFLKTYIAQVGLELSV